MVSNPVICLAWALLIVVLSKSICDASLLTHPRNTVAKVGDKVELKCIANQNQTVIWGFTSSNTSKDIDIYFGDDIASLFKSRYKIDKSIRGQRNLIIGSVDLDHAGRYWCEILGTSNKSFAQLTVVESSPKCSANTSSADKGISEDGYLWMWCRIIYVGNMTPIFTWNKDNTQNPIAADTITSDNGTIPLTTTSSVIAQLRSDDNGAIFKCKITFRLPNRAEEKFPDYEYTWNYTANVLYGTATSDRERTIECTAVNSIATMNENITVSHSGTSHRSVVAAIIGGASFLLLLVIVVVSYFVCRKKPKGFPTKSVSRFRRSIGDEPDIVVAMDINSYDDFEFNPEPSTELHEDSSSEVAENPLYTEIKKGNGQRERERIIKNCSDPIYTDVKKKPKINESSNSNNCAAFNLEDDENSQSPQTINHTKKRQNRIGADGTEYVELSEVRQPGHRSNAPAAKPPAFSRVNYILIDHTARTPPPPPKL